MNAISFLLWKKLGKFQRKIYLYVGYEPDRRDVTERLYGLYIIVFFAIWLVLMLGWAIVTISGSVATMHLSFSIVNSFLGLILALLLIIAPIFAQRRYDLYNFEAADIDFLSQSPFSVGSIALIWFGRWLARPVQQGSVVLALGVLASSLSYEQHDNDWLGLGLGLFSGSDFKCGTAWFFTGYLAYCVTDQM